MGRMLRPFFTLAAACLSLLASPALAQREVPNAPDPYVHGRVGIEFPSKVGPFDRTRIVLYDQAGDDMSAAYTPRNFPTPVLTTIYIYSRIGTCEENFAGTLAPIEDYGAVERLDADVADMAPFAGEEQYFARFLVPAGAYGVDHPDLISDAWLACPEGTNWIVKLRASYETPDAEPLVRRLIENIDWSPLLETR